MSRLSTTFAASNAAAVSLAFSLVLTASPTRADEPRPRPLLRLDSETEYYVPTKPERPIQSVFANATVGVALRSYLVVEAGLTATVAWGSITQLDAQLNSHRYDTRAVGAGPIFLVRCEPFQLGRLSMVIDMLGGIVIYTPHFPPGGDFYNFTWRMGGAFAVRLSDAMTLTVGIRWMHVSNGQGIGPQNPSYEGIGFPVGLSFRF